MGKVNLVDKVVIITGSSQGIGKAIAIAFAKKGAKVVLNGRNIEKLTQTKLELFEKGYEVLAVQADVGVYKECEDLIDQTIDTFGQIDILINNAGIAMEGSIESTFPEVFEKVFHTNILGVLFPTKAAIAHLKKSKGSVVFTGSIAGYMGLPNYSAYSASKMSLTALVQSLKIELADSGVHVGINYVGFAENDADKTYFDEKGDVKLMPVREQFKRMPLAEVADIFIKGIEQRKYKQTLSGIGKLTRFMHQYFPALFEWVMIRKYKKSTSLRTR